MEMLPHFAIMAIFAVLFMIEPHLSCTAITMMVCLIMLLCAGAKVIYFMAGAGAAVAAVAVAVSVLGYAKDRIEFFFDPYKDPLGSGYQIIQSLLAIGSGGLFGRGLGKSIQKFLYLPEPQNDFIFSVLAEELGFIGVVGVIAIFMIFFFRGMKVSMMAPDLYGSLLAVGVTSLIAIQTFMNIMVVTKMIPSTGVSLPFFSAGGTSLVILMASVGILLNISRYSQYKKM
jgi:cell division protein FtsW